MLDPRSLAKRRDEIVESCRRRRVMADVDGAIRAQEQLAAAQTELGEANRQRNEHQASGKRQLTGPEREAHTVEGRRLKNEIAGLEAALARGIILDHRGSDEMTPDQRGARRIWTDQIRLHPAFPRAPLAC